MGLVVVVEIAGDMGEAMMDMRVEGIVGECP